ncbi:hypothetical protein BJ742DRAFT_133822 [Cladochytrium replicatum]|nr:hypothetical protein BJ742DRAFT_133822 [Cladochytrium replicatum]
MTRSANTVSRLWCAAEIGPHMAAIVGVATELVKHDPNYQDDEEDDDEAMEVDGEGSAMEEVEEEEDDADYSDGNDMCWKLRREASGDKADHGDRDYASGVKKYLYSNVAQKSNTIIQQRINTGYSTTPELVVGMHGCVGDQIGLLIAPIESLLSPSESSPNQTCPQNQSPCIPPSPIHYPRSRVLPQAHGQDDPASCCLHFGQKLVVIVQLDETVLELFQSTI